MTNDQERREDRAATYRMHVKEVEDLAHKATTQDLCDAYLKLASGWRKLADEAG